MSHFLNYSATQLKELSAIHTAQEIEQQLQLWPALTQHFKKTQISIETFLQPLLANRSLQIILTGAGTSAFIGEAICAHLNKNMMQQVSSIATTDLVSNPHLYLNSHKPTLLVSFARSGNSPESVAAVAIVDELVADSYHLFITCNEEGELAQSAAKLHEGVQNRFCLLMPSITNDQSFAMTSSYSCMYLSALHYLDTMTPVDKEKQRSVLAQYCSNNKDKYLELSQRLLESSIQRLVFLGSGSLQANARECALKCMELTAGKLVATYDSSLGFRHGPKFIVDVNTLVIVLRSNDAYTQKYDDDIIGELLEDNVAKVCVLNAQRNLKGFGDELNARLLQINNLPLAQNSGLVDVYQGLAWVMFAQIYGFGLSLQADLSPDNPCPSGEVNRVVQGVVIHPLEL